jgi:iron complex transport system permease protein
MLVGPNHKVLLPACVSIGAFSLLMIDDIARAAMAVEIPLSIITAIIGAPFFAYLLRRTGGRWT